MAPLGGGDFKVILKCFGSNDHPSVVEHNFCDICSTSCLSSINGCVSEKENIMSPIGMSFHQKAVLLDGELDRYLHIKEIFSEAYRKDLGSVLLGYQNELTIACKNLLLLRTLHLVFHCVL